MKFAVYISEEAWRNYVGENPKADELKAEIEEALRNHGFDECATVELESKED